MKVQRQVLAIVLLIFSVFGLYFMVMGDLAMSGKPGVSMLPGLQAYFWGFAIVLLLVGIGFMQVDRDEERSETVTTLDAAKK